jgi:DNA-binding MarR family transcriptional regulator
MGRRPNQSPSQTPRRVVHYPTQKEKTERAFGAYLDLLDTADWIQGRLRGQLESFDLTIGGFRLLDLLYRKGPMSLAAACEIRQSSRQNMNEIARRLEERGWVRREYFELPPVEFKQSHLSKSKRGRPRKGRELGALRLTPLGERLIANVIPKRAKLVKALMRAIDAREQQSLSRICHKLREGDVVKFVSEMTHVREEE